MKRRRKQRTSGFTLVETLVTLALFLLIQLGLSHIVDFGSDYFRVLTSDQEDDWAAFVLKLQRDCRNSTLVTVTEDSVSYQKPDQDKPSLARYASDINGRLITGDGHYPLLQPIHWLEVEQIDDYSVRMTCELANGTQKVVTIHFLGTVKHDE